jgi:hypothetical protein
MEEVHTSGLGLMTVQPKDTPECSIFGSLRFGAEHGVVPMAQLLREALAGRGVTLKIIDMAGGGDIDTAVFDGIESCDTFLVFGSAKYGEDTGNQACTYYEYKHAFDRRKRIVLLRMIPFQQDFEELQARVIFGANKLVLPWVVGTPMPDSLVDEILKAMQLTPSTGGGAAATSPTPVASAASSSTVEAAAPAWPGQLALLTGIPSFVECLASLEIHSLEDFGDNLDTDEGHDKLLVAVLDALPTKPRKNKLLRNRAQITLTDLLQRHALFIEFDGDEDGFLSRVECMRIPVEKMRAKAGGTLGDNFDAMDVDKDGRISFAELFLHTEITEGEAVPPLDAAGTRAAEPEPEPEVNTVEQQLAAEHVLAAQRAHLNDGEEEEITVTLGDGRLGIDFAWPYIEKIDPVRDVGTGHRTAPRCCFLPGLLLTFLPLCPCVRACACVYASIR